MYKIQLNVRYKVKHNKLFLGTIVFFLVLSLGYLSTALAADNLIHYDSKALEAVKSEIQNNNSFFVNAYDQLIRAANSELTRDANPVTNKTQVPPSGIMNDYLSLAPYWWPDPDKDDGLPWIWRDGQVNPMTRGDNTDLVRLRGFFNAMEILTLAYYFSDDKKYADKAIDLLNIWLVNSATRVNPHANFAQGIPGRNTGRKIGIIEWSSVYNVIVAIQILDNDGVLPATTKTGVDEWLSEWSIWLRTSEFGIEESNMGNNHGTKYDFQVLGLLLYEGKIADATNLVNQFKTKRIESQIEPDGSQPSELSRTRSIAYSTMNLRGMTEVAQMARHVNVDLWAYRSSDGRSIRKAYDFLRPYVLKQKAWPINTWQQITNGGVEALQTLTKPLFSIGSTVFSEDLIPQSEMAGDGLSYLDKLTYPPRERLIIEGGGVSPITVSITSPENNATFLEPADITITTQASTEEGSISKVEFFNGSTKLGESTSAPYTYTWNNVPAGTYRLSAKATNNEGSSRAAFVTVVVSEPKGPFSGEPLNLPGTIMAVEYDKGGEEVSYHDNSPENRGVEMRDIDFRVNESVDIDNHPDSGYVIGWIADGEWVEYTVAVTEAGEYALEFHTSSRNGGGSIGIDVDGETLLSGITVPQTDDWQSYTTFTETVSLSEGEQVWRVNMESAGFNLHKIVVQPEGTSSLVDHSLSVQNPKPYLLPNAGASHIFYLSREASWDLYSLQGAKLNRGHGNVIDMSTFSRGIYMVRLEGITERLVLR